MEILISSAFDAHVHLRQGDLMKKVVPMINSGGCGTVYVMPNLSPPITTLMQAIQYHNDLKAINPTITYLMSYYLTPSITRQDVIKAKSNSVYGIKWYPRGVTTKSEHGVSDIKECYEILKWMEETDLVLNIHGEVPFDTNVTVLNAEELFIPILVSLRKDFPNLRIVMEHVTTKALVEAVEFFDDNVVATITVHHLDIIVNDWAGCSLNFCKPVAKTPQDREALWGAIQSKSSKFFLGSDSAPHLRSSKLNSPANAGIFTSPIVMPYLAHLFDNRDCLELLENFSSGFGRKFYKLPKETNKIVLRKEIMEIKNNFEVPYFKEGEAIGFSVN